MATTQRAYTLRLSAASREPDQVREVSRLLWHTHLSVNQGARAFGSWLLTLRGGLGHRYAAACTVWETVTAAEVEQACIRTGRSVPEPGALYCHLKDPDRGAVYRRTGADMWARLDRQFLIKLDGEDQPARKASPAELRNVMDVEQELGYQPEQRPARVDELMQYTLRMLRLALRRHATAARITINLSAQEQHLPGSRLEPLTPESRTAQLTDALCDWYALAYSTRWAASVPQKLWTENVVTLLGDVALPLPNEAGSMIARRKAVEVVRSALRSVAQRLAASDTLEGLRRRWFDYWQAGDIRWQFRLRAIRQWVLARGKRDNNSEIRRVGGLSTRRIENVRSIYQLQKAYFGRLLPDAARGSRTRTAAGDAFAQKTLNALERLRENRVKQLSSRIIAAALGLDKELVQRYPGCHAIVVENLSEYGTDQTRSRRENRQLMAWSAAKVRKYLEEGSELYGLYLRTVWPAYTSQQDSRTGAPGIRCRDVPVAALAEPNGYWAAELAAAQHRATKNGGDVRAQFIVDVCARLQTLSPCQQKELGYVRMPYRGGEVFVSADPCSPAAQGIQADLNAAANIGLKALLDPDWPGRWWYVPCDSRTLKPLDKSTKGSAAMSPQTPFTLASGESLDGKSGRPVNLWHDISGESLMSRLWRTYGHYHTAVEQRVIGILRRQLETRLSALADVPF
jgi:IS605 OrfB family transposase